MIAITSDLLLGSKIEATLNAVGHEVALASNLAQASPGAADLLVADLDAEDPQALVATGIPTLGYYSHVNAETKQTADAAGIDLAVPRSRMARELPQLADKLLNAK